MQRGYWMEHTCPLPQADFGLLGGVSTPSLPGAPDGMTKELIGALIRLSMKDGYSDVWSSLPQSLYRARRSLAAEGVHERPDGLYDSNLSITSITITYIGHGLKQIQFFYCFVYKKVHRNQ